MPRGRSRGVWLTLAFLRSTRWSGRLASGRVGV